MSSSEATLRQLRTAETLQSVVTTMKTLSSVRIGQYRRSVAALDASTETLELALQALLTLHPALLETGGALDADAALRSAPALIVFGSDRGLCGPFNDRVARHAADLLTDAAPGSVTPVLAVGRRLHSRLRALGVAGLQRVRPPGNVGGIEGAVAEVLAHVDGWRSEGRASRLVLAYNRPTAGASFEPHALQLLPFDTAWLRQVRERPWPSRRRPMPLADGQRLLQGVVRQMIAHALVRAFAASQASENAARLAAMDAAERNIEERLEQLRTAYRQARQNAVTAELLDIQSAYALVRDRG